MQSTRAELERGTLEPVKVPTPRGLWRLIVMTYELDGERWVPVVRHEFYGDSAEACRQVFGAHMAADAFLRECTTEGSYGGGAVTCHTVIGEPELVR